MTSVAFLIVTFIVYAITPKLLVFSMQIFLCYLISLSVFFVSLSWTHYNDSTYQLPEVCKIVASVTYFAFLSTATWANAISFCIHRKVTKMEVVEITSKKKQKREERIKLLWYMAYAWGVPALLLTIGHIFDSIDSAPDYLQPGFGTETCFIKSNLKKELNFWQILNKKSNSIQFSDISDGFESRLLYYYSPLIIIFLLNGSLFISTAWALYNRPIFTTSQENSEQNPSLGRIHRTQSDTSEDR